MQRINLLFGQRAIIASVNQISITTTRVSRIYFGMIISKIWEYLRENIVLNIDISLVYLIFFHLNLLEKNLKRSEWLKSRRLARMRGKGDEQ